MLEEMKEKFEDSFTDEEKIQIFNLIFSGYYSLSYIRFLAQKKAGHDLGIDVKEPQNLLPPEGEGADYDEYLDAILKMPNKNSILENPNKPESDLKLSMEEEKEEVKPEEVINAPSISVDTPMSEGISESPITSSPLQSSMTSELPGSIGPNSSLEVENNEEEKPKEEVKEEKVESKDIEVEKQEEKEPLTPNIAAEKEEKTEDKPVIEFGVTSEASKTHEPTVEVIQEDMRPKEEKGASEIKFVMPTEGESENTQNVDTVVIPQATSTPEATQTSVVETPQTPAPQEASTPVPPAQEVPTISLDQLITPPTNPQPTQQTQPAQ